MHDTGYTIHDARLKSKKQKTRIKKFKIDGFSIRLGQIELLTMIIDSAQNFQEVQIKSV